MPDDERRRPEPESVDEQILKQLVKLNTAANLTNQKLDDVIAALNTLIGQQSSNNVASLGATVDKPQPQ